MAFWLFFTAMDLLIPGIMVGIGTRFLKHPPGTINAWYGYRTARSMKNQETWDFAHETCGKLWVRLGKLSFLPALLAAVLTFGRGIETVSVASIVPGGAGPETEIWVTDDCGAAADEPGPLARQTQARWLNGKT